jgi:uncharacterized protein
VFNLRTSPLLAILVLSLLLVFRARSVCAQDTSAPPKPADEDRTYLRGHYTKFEYRIPMRDGLKLFTAVYAPKDDSQTYPILLTRSPYSVKPYGVDQYPEPRGPLLRYAKETPLTRTPSESRVSSSVLIRPLPSGHRPF